MRGLGRPCRGLPGLLRVVDEVVLPGHAKAIWIVLCNAGFFVSSESSRSGRTTRLIMRPVCT